MGLWELKNILKSFEKFRTLILGISVILGQCTNLATGVPTGSITTKDDVPQTQ